MARLAEPTVDQHELADRPRDRLDRVRRAPAAVVAQRDMRRKARARRSKARPFQCLDELPLQVDQFMRNVGHGQHPGPDRRCGR